ncbi:MAG: 2Fe-2S iron-sulfur cluster-binding protein, partial [Candidatus Latescibacteria bacterium]|nr:2Fe-2S iron-sulfur cluster-binding protein [Candidatus Latescibacterota bacterium]
MPTLTVNGTEITVPDGTNLIGAAAKVGSHVPHYCYHPDLEVVASCRICFVYREAPGPGGHVMKGLVTACSTPAGDGMIVETDSDDVVKARQDILEFLLINHPTDCPVCDQAGECKLQDYAFAHGHTHSRMTEAKRTLPTKELSSGIRLYTNRCILCDRCVRFLRDYVGTGELSIMNRGNRNEIDIFPG